MKKLEKNKREVAFVSIISVTLICITIYLIAENSYMNDFILIPYLISMYAFNRLYVNGVAGLARALFNIFSYASVLFITTIAANYSNANFDPYILQIIGVIVVFLVYYRMQIPKYIENKVTQFIYRVDISRSTKETNDIPDYSNYEFLQEVKSYTLKPYAFNRCSTEQKLVRIVSSVVLLLLPITSIITEDYMLLFMCIVFAFSIVRYGFMRASILPILIYAFNQLILYIKPAFMLTKQDIVWYANSENYIPKIIIDGLRINSNILRYGLLTLIILWIIFSISKIALIIFRKDKSFINIQTFKKDNASKSCDIFLKDIAPIRLYTKVAKIEIPITKTNGKIDILEIKKLNTIANVSHLEAVDNEFIIAGTEVNEDKSMFYLYAYIKEQEVGETVKLLDDICKENKKRIEAFSVYDDPNWNVYFNEIMPDKYTTQDIFNENYLKTLTKMNIKLEEEHKVLYYFYFKTKKDIKGFLETVKANNFIVESVDDLVSYKDILMIDNDYPYGVVLSNNSKLGIHRINMTTKQLIDNAKDNQGIFDGWALSEFLEAMVKKRLD